MAEPERLPDINTIHITTPFSWLANAWSDLWKAPAIFLTYGLVIALFGASVVLGLALSSMAAWSVALAAGFAFIAPMLAMGVYEGGRLLEAGRKPSLAAIGVIRAAFRGDVVLLGVALLLIYGIWLELARIVYGLSSSRLDVTLMEFFAFATTTSAGLTMLLWGSALGGLLAWFTFCLVVVSAPMLLDTRRDIFIASVTSVRCVVRNTLPMLVWAVAIAALLLASILTAFAGLIIVIPWLGLASWRAYRSLVRTPENKP